MELNKLGVIESCPEKDWVDGRVEHVVSSG
jgi:hypothetical protein